jgi:DNA-binding protein HU-beta
MNKGQLITAFAAKTSTKNSEAKTLVEAFANLIKEQLLAGEEVTLPGVGKLKVHGKAARPGRNPATGEAISIPEKRVVKFSPSSDFDEVFTVVAK